MKVTNANNNETTIQTEYNVLQSNGTDTPVKVNIIHDESAKEMFEKLGYRQVEVYELIMAKIISYRKNNIWIYFKEVDGEKMFLKYRDGIYLQFPEDITFEELKAINKQISDLGWDNE